MTDAVVDVIGETVDFRKESRQEFAVPFMQQVVDIGGMRSRVRRMTPEERKALVDKVGIERVMKIIDGGGDHAF